MFDDCSRLVGERDQLRTDLDEARERLALMGETNGELVEERDKLNSEIKSLRLGVAPGIEENQRLRASNDRNATERAQALARAKKAEQERDIALETLESVRARVDDVLNPPLGSHLDEEMDDDE